METAAVTHTSLFHRLARRLRPEQGFILPVALGVSSILAIVGTSAMAYSTENYGQASRSKADQSALALAQAGIDNTMSVLNLPTNNALLQSTLPPCTSNQKKYSDPLAVRTAVSTWRHTPLGDGSVDWCATLVPTSQLWYVTSIGNMRNPTRASATMTRTVEATVPVQPVVTQPLNNPVWNYIYAGHTGSTCDQTLNNNVNGSSRMYVAGNLCVGNNAVVTETSLVVGGNLSLSGGNTAVGASTSMSTRVETYAGGNCSFGTALPIPCIGNLDALKIYSKLADGLTAGINHSPPTVPPPTADFATWYRNALPGPAQGCAVSSGPVPTFDTNYPARDTSVPTVFNMTPAQAYDCRVGPADNPSGEIRWTPPTATAAGQLYMTGTIYIDGSAIIGTGTASSTFAVQYSGMSTLYLSGTYDLNGKLCATITTAQTNCDFTPWNPNATMMTIVADGNGGQVPTGDSIKVENNSQIQGALYGTNGVEFGNNAYSDGPIVGSFMVFGNNVTTNSFPTIATVPTGMPSNPAVFAQPSPPVNFSG